MISFATFPGYFLKEKESIITAQAQLDLQVFKKIAGELNITARYVGEEPDSLTTNIYNRVMTRELTASGIRCEVIPRNKIGGTTVSASGARQALKQDDWEAFRLLVPETTWEWFSSSAAGPVIEKLKTGQG